MKPIVHELEKEYTGEIDFVYLNIDDPANTDAKLQYGFRYQPQFILLDGEGQIVTQWLGYNSPNVFEDAFANILAN